MGAAASSPGQFGFTEIVQKGTDDTNGDIRRQKAYKDELRLSSLGAATLYDTWQKGLAVARDSPAFGTRTIEKVEIVDGKEVITAGPFKWMTYGEAQVIIDKVGSAIVTLGLAPVNDTQHKLLGIYAKNRAEYSLLVQACNAFGLADVPLYDTLGVDAVSYIVGQTGITTVFAAKAEAAKLVKFKGDPASGGHMAALANVVSFEDVDDAARAAAARAGITLRSWSELLEVGTAHPLPHAPPKPDDLAYICYTSGTTGMPKGAMISHRNMVADASGAIDVELNLSHQDVYLSYLPLAHVMERLVQAALSAVGAEVGFFQGDTLKLMDDIKELRPTVFVSVPRLYNRIYDRIMGGVEAAGGVKAALFHSAFASKRSWLGQNYLHHSLWDPLVFAPIKKRVGLDRVRILVTGSAPLAAHVTEFVRIVFGAPLIEGYGQTECSAAATATSMWDHGRKGHVGTPLACNEIKLVSVPDMGYRVTDTVHGREVDAEGAVVSAGLPCVGRGEVCYRGPNVFAGYYKDAAKTAEVLEADGWLHSGDIGLWDADGNLRIIDRKKNIFKLAQGEYVAAEKIENAYLKSPFIAQVFVHGDSLHSVLLAVVVPSEDHGKVWAHEHGGAGAQARFAEGGVAALCGDAAFKAAVLADIVRVGKEAKLQGFEIVKAIHLDATPWTPESILTPTFKLKRNDAKVKYAKELDDMYARVDVVAGKANVKQGKVH